VTRYLAEGYRTNGHPLDATATWGGSKDTKYILGK